MNLTYINFPLGWLPSQDPVNGNPQGLTRMDNCYLDELGVLSMVQGIQRINPQPFPYYPDRIYCKILDQNTEAIWVSLGATGSNIIRSKNGTFSDQTIIGVGTDRGCFGDCLGEVLCCAGALRIKDNATKVNNLGLATPGVPVVNSVSQPVLAMPGIWSFQVGTIVDSTVNGAYGLMTATNVQAIVLNQFYGTLNTEFIGAGPAEVPGNDTFTFNITPDDPSNVTDVIVEVLLSLEYQDRYVYAFDSTTLASALSPGPEQQTTLSLTRSQFQRFGRNFALDWTTVVGIRFTVQANTQMNVNITNPTFTGGSEGQISGSYQYIQVNINNNGFYEAKSPPSTATASVTLLNGMATITPSATEPQVNTVWIYRYGGNLDQYYLVGTTTPGVSLVDNQSDDQLLETDLFLNPFLLTLLYGDVNSINDTVYCIEGLFYDRMLFMGEGFIYISDSLNPDAVDSRYIIKAFGDPSEKNLWIRKITNNVCLLGTNKNLYEITGTFQPLPDGSIDASINPIGETHPPITADVTSSEGTVFYMAADGIRISIGSNSTILNPGLRMLFNGETRGGVAPFVISSFANYPMAISKTRFYVSIPSVDGTQRLVVYDLINNYWRFQYTDPVALFTSPTDRLLMGYNDSVGGDIYQADTGLGVTDNEGNQINGYELDIRTVFDANQQPRNRKDTFTLKLIVDTGGASCSVYVAKDEEGATYSLVGNFATNGLTTVYFPLNNFTLGFRYSFRIVDNGSVPNNVLLTFKLYELTMEYDPRPEQLDYLRIQPNNLGTISRKRMVNYAFVIDTLGNNITCTPYIDNSNSGILPANRTFSTPAKQTYIYYFTQEQIGTDINAILSGGVFEFYGLNEQEIISEKMPVPCEFLVIPNNDYGIPNRKRHSSYKFQINTRGVPVTFTPKLDGVFLTPVNYTTTEKRVVEYFFDDDTIAIEVGGALQSTVDGTPFEFYGVVTPQQIEQLPPRLTYYRIPNDNMGVAARKRVRTLPFVIDTYGQPINFQPIVDSILYPAQTFTTVGKTTCLYYFNTDTFGIDYGGQVVSQGSQPFEFYGLGQPERVEVLPVGKTYDQLGPTRFDKIGKLFTIRIRLIDTGNGSIPLTIYGDADPTDPQYDGGMYSTVINTQVLVDYVYEIQLPKSVNSDIIRIALGNVSLPFHRFDCQIKVSSSGMESDSQWIPIR